MQGGRSAAIRCHTWSTVRSTASYANGSAPLVAAGLRASTARQSPVLACRRMSGMVVNMFQHTVWQSAQRQIKMQTRTRKTSAPSMHAIKAHEPASAARLYESVTEPGSSSRRMSASSKSQKVCGDTNNKPTNSHAQLWHTTDAAQETRCACAHLLQHGLHICGRKRLSAILLPSLAPCLQHGLRK